jgi:septin family protein
MGGGQAKSSDVKGAEASHAGKKNDGASRTILLLGTAGVGKSTIVKQLTMSWGSGLTDQKKNELRDAIRRNCIKRLIDIVNYAGEDQHEEVLSHLMFLI